MFRPCGIAKLCLWSGEASVACFSEGGVNTVWIFSFFSESDRSLVGTGFSKFWLLENRLIMSEQATLSCFPFPAELSGPSDINLVENDSLTVFWSLLSFLSVDWLPDLSENLGFLSDDLGKSFFSPNLFECFCSRFRNEDWAGRFRRWASGWYDLKWLAWWL